MHTPKKKILSKSYEAKLTYQEFLDFLGVEGNPNLHIRVPREPGISSCFNERLYIPKDCKPMTVTWEETEEVK